jgi:hypothetical protein
MRLRKIQKIAQYIVWEYMLAELFDPMLHPKTDSPYEIQNLLNDLLKLVSKDIL